MDNLEITLHNAQDGHRILSRLWPQIKTVLLAGHKLTLELRAYDDDKTAKQRKYYHAYVLTEIARQARPDGKQYPMAVWKEHFRRRFLGENGNKRRTVIDPMTGKKSRRQVRISTETLGVKAYNKLIEQVTAFAAVDLRVQFSERWETWTDPETGEILNKGKE